MKIYLLVATATATAAATTAAISTTTAVFTTRSTATAAAPAAGRTIFTRTSHVDRKGATVELVTVQSVNGFLRFVGAAHGDETETARTAAHAVHHQVSFHNGAVCGKRVGKIVFSGVEGKISNKQFCAHVMFNCPRLTLLSPDRSRIPGFKSSLNVVHLRIHHDVEAIASTDPLIVKFSAKIARANSTFIS